MKGRRSSMRTVTTEPSTRCDRQDHQGRHGTQVLAPQNTKCCDDQCDHRRRDGLEYTGIPDRTRMRCGSPVTFSPCQASRITWASMKDFSSHSQASYFESEVVERCALLWKALGEGNTSRGGVPLHLRRINIDDNGLSVYIYRDRLTSSGVVSETLSSTSTSLPSTPLKWGPSRTPLSPMSLRDDSLSSPLIQLISSKG